MIGKNFTSASKEDCIYTPYSMTEQLLENEKFDYDKTVLEPACGQGAISKIIDTYFRKNYFDDLILGGNFFEYNSKELPSYIITMRIMPR